MITTKDIEKAVVKYYNPRTNLIIPNVSWGFFIHECDLLIMTRADYLYEVEIKISKADLVKDKNKWHGHRSGKIRKLYFAIPSELLKYSEHIPERAGILEIITNYTDDNIAWYSCKKIRESQLQNTEPLTIQKKYELARLGAMRIWRGL